MNYVLDKSLFIGDPEEKALMFRWQEKPPNDGTLTPWTEQLTWEQLELANIIGKLNFWFTQSGLQILT